MSENKVAAAFGRVVSRHIWTAWIVGFVFIAQKLFGAIDWSWWAVTCPFWGSGAYILIVFAFVVLLAIAMGDDE